MYIIFSDYPYLHGQLGSDSYLSYPPPSEYWTLSIDDNQCTPINYKGVFQWNDLIQCQDYNNQNLMDIQENEDTVTLVGTLYVSIVSPLTMDSESGFYRIFSLIQ